MFIGSVGMGVLNKCYLRFPRAFWPHDADWLEYVSDPHGEWTENGVSFQRVAELPDRRGSTLLIAAVKSRLGIFSR